MWDVATATVNGLSQLVITIYGVVVSVEKNRIRNALVIGILGLLGISLTVYGTIRNDQAQTALQGQLNQIQKNTETPPKVEVNVPPSPVPLEHTRVNFLVPEFVRENPLIPFHTGQIPALNIG